MYRTILYSDARECVSAYYVFAAASLPVMTSTLKFTRVLCEREFAAFLLFVIVVLTSFLFLFFFYYSFFSVFISRGSIIVHNSNEYYSAVTLPPSVPYVISPFAFDCYVNKRR